MLQVGKVKERRLKTLKHRYRCTYVRMYLDPRYVHLYLHVYIRTYVRTCMILPLR